MELAPTHSCSCHVNGQDCGICKALECRVNERKRLYRSLIAEARANSELDDDAVLARWLGKHEHP